MRIIKLSPDEREMSTLEAAEAFFTLMATNNPTGRFLLTGDVIGQNGIAERELLVFAYMGQILFLAEAGSTRQDTIGTDAGNYPHYFNIDINSLRPGTGQLTALANQLVTANLYAGNIVTSREWPRVNEDGERRGQFQTILENFVAPNS